MFWESERTISVKNAGIIYEYMKHYKSDIQDPRPEMYA